MMGADARAARWIGGQGLAHARDDLGTEAPRHRAFFGDDESARAAHRLDEAVAALREERGGDPEERRLPEGGPARGERGA